MRYLFVILVIAGILFQSFSKVIIIVNFKLNQDYIAQNLCVKKDVEANHCKGSCHLKKQFHDVEKKEQSTASSLKDIKEFQIICQNTTSFKFHPTLMLEMDFAPYPNSITSSSTISIFHPPKV